jgi:hypothetical protein
MQFIFVHSNWGHSLRPFAIKIKVKDLPPMKIQGHEALWQESRSPEGVNQPASNKVMFA